MKKYLLIIFVVCFSFNVFGQNKKQIKPAKFDAKLAAKLGADDYGMKTYVLVFLKRGDKTFEKTERDELIAKHLQNIKRLAKEGSLIVAGPFMSEQDNFTGLFLFDVKTLEEAEKLVQTDPTIQRGLFKYEMHLWYGSAALLEIPELHGKVQKKSF